MKKNILLIVLGLIIIPLGVLAKDNNSIQIETISINKKNGSVEEVSKPLINNQKLSFNLIMYNVGDYVEYNVRLKNNSKENYYINEDTIVEKSNNIKYKIDYDDTNILKPNNSKTIRIKIIYNKAYDKKMFKSGKYHSNTSSILNISNNIPFLNPNTASNYVSIFALISIVILLSVSFKRRTYIPLIIITVILPISVFADNKIQISINSNILIKNIEPNPCKYSGELVPGAEFTKGQYTYRYSQQGDYSGWKYINDEGWGVKLTNLASTDEVNTKICTSINDKPIVSTSYMFANSMAEKIDLSSFDSSQVKNMQYMFYDSKVKDLNIENLDTNMVSDMNHIFANTQNLKSFDGSKLETPNLVNMNSMFYNSTNLEKINLNNLGSDKLFDMNSIFDCNYSLKELNMKNFNFGIINNVNGIFYKSYNHMKNIEKIDLSYSNMKNINSLKEAFYEKTKLKEVDMSYANMENVKDLTGLFEYDSSLTTFNMENANTPNLQSTVYMFKNCTNLNSLNISGISLKNILDMKYMFQYCSSLTSIDLSEFTTPKVQDMHYLFEGCTNLKSVDISNLGSPYLTNCQEMFQTEYITKLKIHNFNFGTSYVDALLNNLPNLEEIDLTNSDLSNTKNISHLFYNNNDIHRKIKKINLQNVKFGTNISLLFKDMINLEEINLKNADVSNVTSMTSLFEYDSKLKKIDLSTWDTSNVTQMDYLFARCTQLNDLDLKNINTSKVKNMLDLFYDNTNLKELDLTSFDTHNVENMNYMFGNCSNLEKIYVSDGFVIPNSARDIGMFSNDIKLVGGNGTRYDSNKTNSEYARIDGKDNLPGYFTKK